MDEGYIEYIKKIWPSLMPKLTPAELMDKYTIICLKNLHWPENELLIRQKERLGTAIKGLNPTDDLYELLKKLYEENKIIWDYESQIREMNTDKSYILVGQLEEKILKQFSSIGILALKIRHHNTQRVKIKNLINELFKEELELKFNYTGTEEIK